jgi:hypothetical protein
MWEESLRGFLVVGFVRLTCAGIRGADVALHCF